MTDWATMTDKEKNNRVAELCGLCTHPKTPSTFYNTIGVLCPDCGEIVDYKTKPPNYIHDLNAMREAEAHLLCMHTYHLWKTYVSILKKVEKAHNGWIGTYTVRASAAQRAEAFVKTMEGGGE